MRTSEPPPRSSSFGHFAEKFLNFRSTLGGGHTQVTMLLADLKVSVEVLGAQDPEQARRLLPPVVEGMMAVMHRSEVTVNQMLGDVIIALCGALITSMTSKPRRKSSTR
jgi:class 3 adenylate cyclase